MAMDIAADHFLVVDLEATCDEGAIPRSERETIEIGAVLVDVESLEIVKQFQGFVKPVRHPELTPYCVDLTGITQAEVDQAEPFAVVFDRFLNEMVRDRNTLFVSWGGFDLRQLSRDCAFHGLVNPIEDRLDLSFTFTEHAGLRRRPSMRDAMSLVSLPVEGTLHRGIDDARNLARLLPWCIGRASFPEE